MNQSEIEVNTNLSVSVKREKTQVTISFGFTSDGLRKWPEISQQINITFNTHLKTALFSTTLSSYQQPARPAALEEANVVPLTSTISHLNRPSIALNVFVFPLVCA